MVKINFKHIREKRRISQQSLAMRVGVSQPYLNQIENDSYKASPRIDLLDNIAKELGVCLFDIIECECNNKDYKNCKRNNIELR